MTPFDCGLTGFWLRAARFATSMIRRNISCPTVLFSMFWNILRNLEGVGRDQLTRNRDNLLRYVNLREKRDYYCARDDMEGEDQQREELWQAVSKCEDLIQALARN